MESNNIPVNYDLNEMLTGLNGVETVDDVIGRFDRVLDDINMNLQNKKGKKYEEIMNKAYAIIQENYADHNLSIYTVADMIDLSPAYFGRLFKKMASVQLSDYLNEIRISKAKEFLRTTELSINEVAEKVGFSNANYFYTLFRKLCSVTPSDYRRNKIDA